MLARACRWLAERHVVPALAWSYTLVDGVPMLSSSWRSGAAVLLWGAVVGALAWASDRAVLRELAAGNEEAR